MAIKYVSVDQLQLSSELDPLGAPYLRSCATSNLRLVNQHLFSL